MTESDRKWFKKMKMARNWHKFKMWTKNGEKLTEINQKRPTLHKTEKKWPEIDQKLTKITKMTKNELEMT